MASLTSGQMSQHTPLSLSAGDLLHTPAPTNKQAHVMSAPGYLKETPIWTDWILFEVGWVSGIAWFIGVFVPLCRRPRFPAPRNKAGWIANLIGNPHQLLPVILLTSACFAAGCTVLLAAKCMVGISNQAVTHQPHALSLMLL